VGRLRDKTEPVDRVATQGLVQLGSTARPWVLRAMRDSNPQVRRLACSILFQTAPDRASEALEALLVAVKESDASVRAAAVGQLEFIVSGHGSAPDASLRERALRALGASLGDDSSPVRETAVWAFWRLGPVARPVASDLDHALDGPDKQLRILAGWALLRIDAEMHHARVVAALSPMLTDQTIRFDHYRLVQVLVEAQGQDSTATMLIPLIKHPDIATRIQAINDMTRQCESSTTAQSLMIESLSSDDAHLRGEAALFVLRHEPAMAARALDTLAERLADPAGCDLGLIKSIRESSPQSMKPLVSRLTERLAGSREDAARASVMAAVGEIGTDALAAVPALVQLSKSSDLKSAVLAIQCLVKIDRAAAETRLPALIEWMTAGHDPAVRVRAMETLGDLGPPVATAIPALLTAADEPDLAIATVAVEAISKINPATGSSLKRAIAARIPQTHDDQPQ
jgi:HEAT repeat protein